MSIASNLGKRVVESIKLSCLQDSRWGTHRHLYDDLTISAHFTNLPLLMRLYVTFVSLDRPPQAGGGADAQQRLPTSATCMNLLKLPPYGSREALEQKLGFALREVAGFDLS